MDGSAKFNVKVFGKTVAEKEFAKGNFLIYETGNSHGLIKDLGAVSLQSSSVGFWEDVDIDAVYENESRTYASFPTEWYADVPDSSLMAADYSHGELKKISGNVYTESAPQLCEVGGQIIMVMQWDSSERADIDRSMLVYSLYDEATNTWSYPVAVDDDGTADFYPCFQDGYLVWQNEKTTLSDSMTLSEIAALGEICVSKWDGSGFTSPVILTNNDSLDTLPQVAASGAGVSIVWITNSENDILGLSGTNTIMSRYLNEELSPEEDAVALAGGLNAVTDLAIGNIGEKLCVAYVVDGDSDLSTVDDWEIWSIKDGISAKLTENNGLDSNPVFAGGQLYYYSMGNIVITSLDGTQDTVFNESRQGSLTDSFCVTANDHGNIAVWWAKTLENSTELFATLYRDNSWSDEIQITSMDARVRYPSGLLHPDGSMLVAFSSATIEDDSITKTDLYTISLTPAYDLELLDVSFDEETMTAYATVKNSGELEMASYRIELLDNGDVNNTMTMDTPLKAGESAEIVLPYKMGPNMSKRMITLKVSATAEEEYNTENNSATFTIGHADAAVGSVSVGSDGTTIFAEVSNAGYSTARNILVQLRQNTAEGTVLKEQRVNLSPGEKQTMEFLLDRSFVKGEGEVQFYVTAAIAEEGVSLGNNEGYVFVPAQSDYRIEILGFKQIGGRTMVNSYAGNDSDSILSCTIYAAVYSSTGKFKGCGSCPVTINAGNDIGVDTWVSCSVESGDTIKTFILNASMQPLVSCSDYVND